MTVRFHPDADDRVLAIRYVDGPDDYGPDPDAAQDAIAEQRFADDVEATARHFFNACKAAIPPHRHAAVLEAFRSLAVQDLADPIDLSGREVACDEQHPW